MDVHSSWWCFCSSGWLVVFLRLVGGVLLLPEIVTQLVGDVFVLDCHSSPDVMFCYCLSVCNSTGCSTCCTRNSRKSSSILWINISPLYRDYNILANHSVVPYTVSSCTISWQIFGIVPYTRTSVPSNLVGLFK